MFSLHEEKLDVRLLEGQMKDAGCGALVTFEGWVRNRNEGRRVIRLDYEAYTAVAIAEGDRIIQEARRRFDIRHAACAHRVGALAIGDIAVWVGVSAAHRGDAFNACRFIIDEIKHAVPIWKKEYYEDGDSGWVNCDACARTHTVADASVEPSEYYQRQVRLPQVGREGQQRLADARVLVVGAGGLGCSVIPSLTAAGVGTVGICDGDMVEISNLHRQPLYAAADAGRPKAHLAAERMRALNPLVKVCTHVHALTWENAEGIIDSYDVLVDCTDNFEAKYLLNDIAVAHRKALVQASIFQYEGQLFVYDPAAKDACLRCLWPEPPTPGCVGACADVGVLGVVPCVFGALQAAEVLKLLLRLPGRLSGEMLFYDLLEHRMRRVPIARDSDCPVCSGKAAPAVIHDFADVEIAWDALPEGAVFVDVREAAEVKAEPIVGLPHIVCPASRMESCPIAFEPGLPYVLLCTLGRRSRLLATMLRAQGSANVYSLRGGIRGMKVLAGDGMTRAHVR